MARKKIVVQAGHAPPREKGHEKQTGAYREIEFTTLVANALVTAINDDPRLEGVFVPGDIPNGVRCDAFISEHGDGSGSPSKRGFCFGYPSHAVNKRLADLIATEYLKLPGHPPRGTDNYTADLRGYYGFGLVNTPGPEVLVESGFLSNAVDRAWMFGNIEEIAAAQYRGLLRFFNLSLPDDDVWQPGEPVWQNLPGPKPKPKWFWDAVTELDRRRKIVGEP